MSILKQLSEFIENMRCHFNHIPSSMGKGSQAPGRLTLIKPNYLML